MNNKKFIGTEFSTGKKLSYYSPFYSIIVNKTSGLLRLPNPPRPLAYLSAPLAVFLVVALQYILLPEPSIAPFVFFFPGAALVAFLAGLPAGLSAVLLSALAGNFFFVAPFKGWSLSVESLLATFFFAASSLVLVLLSVYLRKTIFNFNRAVKEREVIEEEVKHANREWNRTFDAISDLTFIQDKDFRIVRANSAFLRALKLKSEDVLGKKCYEIMHRSDKPWPNCPLKRTITDKQSHTEEVFDSNIGLPLLVTTSPIIDKAGNFVGSIHIAKDITLIKRAEEALTRSEESMKKAQEIAHLGSWELDLVNNNLTWSDEIYRIFGLKPEGFGATYQAFLEAVHPDDRELVNSAYYNSLKNGKDAYEIEHRVMRKANNEIRFVHEKCRHIRDKSGRFVLSVGMVHDITERKLMEEGLRSEKAKAEALLSSLGDGVVAVDTAGKILFVNSAFADLVRKDRNDLLGRSLEEAVPLEDDQGNYLAPASRPFHQVLTSGKKISSGIFSPTHYYIRQGGGLIHLAITIAPIVLDGAVMGAIAVYRDVSREKAVDQAKTEFVSLASHQLRTPLSGIALSIELLLRGAAGKISPEQKNYLSEAYASTKTMAELIKVLLDISRIELGTYPVRLEPIDLVEELNHLLDRQKLQFDKKNISLKRNYGGVSVIHFDKNILYTTIENLIANAIRYTAAGAITVNLEKNPKEIIIKIADTGCGIPDQDKAKIFTKLFRSENAKLISSDGAGLGLYLVKSLLDIVRSRIWLESELGKGTTFFVAIPLSK